MNVDGDVRDLPSQQEADAFAAERFLRFVRRHRDSGPWFAVLAPSTPHDPYTPSPAHRHDFDGVAWDPPAFNEPDMTDKPSWLRDLPPQDRDRMRRVFEGKLEELQDLDDLVGRVLDVLWRTGQLGRTWIFFVSDNGYLLGEHRLFRKEQPYEESAGIPFVVRGPGVEPGTSDALVSQVDLMPTALDIAGARPGRRVGTSTDARCSPRCGPGTGRAGAAGCSSRTPTCAGRCCARRRGLRRARRGGEWELYDLAADPHQLASRADADVTEWSARTARLREARGVALRRLEV